jgi:hypothetical protein
MRGRHIAVVCVPLFFGCTVLTDLDGLQGKSDGGKSDGGADARDDGVSLDSPVTIEDGVDVGLDSDSGTSKIWIDDFNRADNPAILNNWTMKTAGSHDLFNNQVRVRTGADYHDNVVFRPTIEDVRDVTVSVEFSVTALPPGYPQIMARIQQNTVLTALAFDAYMLFLPAQADLAVIGRQRGSSYLSTLKNITLSPTVDTSHTYRMTLTASGANPVSLSATIEVRMGNMWSTIGMGTFTDTDTTRLDGAGAVGFGSSGDETVGLYSYDNFTRISL